MITLDRRTPSPPRLRARMTRDAGSARGRVAIAPATLPRGLAP